MRDMTIRQFTEALERNGFTVPNMLLGGQAFSLDDGEESYYIAVTEKRRAALAWILRARARRRKELAERAVTPEPYPTPLTDDEVDATLRDVAADMAKALKPAG